MRSNKSFNDLLRTGGVNIIIRSEIIEIIHEYIDKFNIGGGNYVAGEKYNWDWFYKHVFSEIVGVPEFRDIRLSECLLTQTYLVCSEYFDTNRHGKPSIRRKEEVKTLRGKLEEARNRKCRDPINKNVYEYLNYENQWSEYMIGDRIIDRHALEKNIVSFIIKDNSIYVENRLRKITDIMICSPELRIIMHIVKKSIQDIGRVDKKYILKIINRELPVEMKQMIKRVGDRRTIKAGREKLMELFLRIYTSSIPLGFNIDYSIKRLKKLSLFGEWPGNHELHTFNSVKTLYLILNEALRKCKNKNHRQDIVAKYLLFWKFEPERGELTDIAMRIEERFRKLRKNTELVCVFDHDLLQFKYIALQI